MNEVGKKENCRLNYRVIIDLLLSHKIYLHDVYIKKRFICSS